MKPISRKAPTIILNLAAITALASPGWCTSVTITNPSFESPDVGSSFTSLDGNGWATTGGGTVIDGYDAQFNSIPNGTQVAIMDDFNGVGTFYQVLTADVAANTTYTLTFYVGQSTLLGYDGYYAALEACNSCTNGSGSVLASQNISVTPVTNGNGNFVQETIVYNSGTSPANLGQPLEILFSDTAYQAVAFDEVALDASPTVAPEPGTWLLLAAGIGGLGVAKRRVASRAIRC